MAHNLEFKNGEYSFAENRKKHIAWHGLGQVFDGEMDVPTALKLSHADFNVVTIPAGFQLPTGEWKADKDHCYTQREDNGDILGLVTSSYGVVQNAAAFDFVDNLCTGKSGEPFIESAGVLGKGERVFVTAKFPERFKIGDELGDDGEMYAVITTSHDGFGAVTVMMTPIRVVCNNTLTSAMLHNYSKFSFKHTSGVNSRMRDNLLHASKVLGVYNATLKAINEQTAALAKINVNHKMVEDIAAKMAFGNKLDIFKREGLGSENLSTNLKNTYNGLLLSVEKGVGQDIFKKKDGNWLFNGFSTFFQNHTTYGTKGVKDDQTRKFDNFFGGTVYKRLNTAFDDILAYNLAA